VEKGKDGKNHISGGKSNRRGTPQGGVISPLLANLYLHLLDRIWKRHNLERRYAARLVRYADDMVVLSAQDTDKPLSMLKHVLERLGLTLNEAKTNIVNAWDTSFDFLGFEIWMQRSMLSGKAYPHVQPGKKAVARIKAQTTDLTRRALTPMPLPMLMKRLNQTLRGWTGYFHYRNSTQVLKVVKWHAEERLRTHLRKRHKIKFRAGGYERVKNIGKPYTGKPYVRFDEGGLAKDSMDWLLRHRQTKGAETDRPIPTESGGCPLLYPYCQLIIVKWIYPFSFLGYSKRALLPIEWVKLVTE